MRVSWFYAWGARQSCPIVWNCLLVDEHHLCGQEDVRVAACNGTPVPTIDESCVECDGAVPEEDNSSTRTLVAAELRIWHQVCFAFCWNRWGGGRFVQIEFHPYWMKSRKSTCVMLVNAYFEWCSSISFLDIDFVFVVATLIWSTNKV
jgi:hypothetical protein